MLEIHTHNAQIQNMFSPAHRLGGNGTWPKIGQSIAQRDAQSQLRNDVGQREKNIMANTEAFAADRDAHRIQRSSYKKRKSPSTSSTRSITQPETQLRVNEETKIRTTY